MNPQVNWQKIRDEFQRLTDVEQLKTEVHRIGSELRKFDLQSVLSPAAQEKVKHFEKRYAELVRTLTKAQTQVDREFNRLMKQIKDHRADVTKVMNEQKGKLEKISSELKRRFVRTEGAATKRARPARRASTPDPVATKPTRAPKRQTKAMPKRRGVKT